MLSVQLHVTFRYSIRVEAFVVAGCSVDRADTAVDDEMRHMYALRRQLSSARLCKAT